MLHAIFSRRKPHKGLAGLKFIDGLFLLLKKHDCKLFCSLAKYGVDVPLRGEKNIKSLEKTHLTPRDDGYTTRLLNELEITLYDKICEFTERNNITQSKIFPDQSEYKADDLRKTFFYNSQRLYVKAKSRNFIFTRRQWVGAQKNLRYTYNFEVIKSSEHLQIQIADMICFVINWGFDANEATKQSELVHQHIAKIYAKHSQTSLGRVVN